MTVFLCVCGHEKLNHFYADELAEGAPHVGLCGSCRPVFDHLHKFKPNNLKYLEQLYENKRTHNLYK